MIAATTLTLSFDEHVTLPPPLGLPKAPSENLQVPRAVRDALSRIEWITYAHEGAVSGISCICPPAPTLDTTAGPKSLGFVDAAPLTAS